MARGTKKSLRANQRYLATVKNDGAFKVGRDNSSTYNWRYIKAVANANRMRRITGMEKSADDISEQLGRIYSLRSALLERQIRYGGSITDNTPMKRLNRAFRAANRIMQGKGTSVG